MHATPEHTTSTPEVSDLADAAARAERWAGEPFLHPDEDVAIVLAPGTARRRALDEALAELATGNRKPSHRWKVRFALMLGLERVLSQTPPPLASSTELRRHQVDALAGMLTELIAANEHAALDPGSNGGPEPAEDEDDEPDDELGLSAEEDEGDESGFEGDDPGAVRRF